LEFFGGVSVSDVTGLHFGKQRDCGARPLN
jgi:hypothetical protein